MRIMDIDTWAADVDLGDMFLNYFLDKRLRAAAGVDVSQVVGKAKQWKRWERYMMGLRTSPYVACKLFGVTLEIIRGDRADPTNVFRWHNVKLNLPGDPGYTPTRPWVQKVRIDGTPSANVVSYVDDIRPIGSSEKDCQAAARRMAAITNYLGEQDAPRKRRPASLKPGPWAGAMIAADEMGLRVYVSQEKWDKTKRILVGLRDALINKSSLDRKQLERDRGFLVYVSRTYPVMVPFLKGIHLTLESWRKDRDLDGWKIELKDLDDTEWGRWEDK